ncbi:hypothetical protein [Holospora obtusa]|nr:hypothetical protein [Holospora obtusa]
MFFVNRGFSVKKSEIDSALNQLKDLRVISLEKSFRNLKILLSVKDKKRAKKLLKQTKLSKLCEKINSCFSEEIVIQMISMFFDKKNHQDLAKSVLKMFIKNLSDQNLILYTKTILSKRHQNQALKNVTEANNDDQSNRAFLDVFSPERANKAFDALDLSKFNNINTANVLNDLLSCILSPDNDPELANKAFDVVYLNKSNKINADDVLDVLSDSQSLIFSADNNAESQNKLVENLGLDQSNKINADDVLDVLSDSPSLIFSSDNNAESQNKLVENLGLDQSNKINADDVLDVLSDSPSLIFSSDNNAESQNKLVENFDFLKKCDFLKFDFSQMFKLDGVHKINRIDNEGGKYYDLSYIAGPIFSSKSNHELARRAYKTLILPQLGQISDDYYLDLMKNILNTENNLSLCEEAFNALDLEKLNQVDDDGLADIICGVLEGRNIHLGIKVLNACDLQRVRRFCDKNFAEVVASFLDCERDCVLAKKVQEFLDLSKLSKIDDDFFFIVIKKSLDSRNVENNPERVKTILNIINLEKRGSTLDDSIFSEIIKKILFANNNPVLAEKALDDLDLKKRASEFQGDNFFNLLQKVLSANNNPVLAGKALDDLDLKKRASKFQGNDFFNLLKKILSLKDVSTLAEKALDDLDLKKRASEFQGDDFFDLVQNVLSLKNNETSEIKKLSKTVKIQREENEHLFLKEYMKKISSENNNPVLAEKALDDLDLKKRVSTCDDKRFSHLVEIVLCSKNSPRLAKKALNNLNLKKRSGELSSDDFSILIQKILSEVNNLELAKNALGAINLEKRIKNSPDNLAKIVQDITFVNSISMLDISLFHHSKFIPKLHPTLIKEVFRIVNVGKNVLNCSDTARELLIKTLVNWNHSASLKVLNELEPSAFIMNDTFKTAKFHQEIFNSVLNLDSTEKLTTLFSKIDKDDILTVIKSVFDKASSQQISFFIRQYMSIDESFDDTCAMLCAKISDSNTIKRVFFDLKETLKLEDIEKVKQKILSLNFVKFALDKEENLAHSDGQEVIGNLGTDVGMYAWWELRYCLEHSEQEAQKMVLEKIDAFQKAGSRFITSDTEKFFFESGISYVLKNINHYLHLALLSTPLEHLTETFVVRAFRSDLFKVFSKKEDQKEGFNFLKVTEDNDKEWKQDYPNLISADVSLDEKAEKEYARVRSASFARLVRDALTKKLSANLCDCNRLTNALSKNINKWSKFFVVFEGNETEKQKSDFLPYLPLVHFYEDAVRSGNQKSFLEKAESVEGALSLADPQDAMEKIENLKNSLNNLTDELTKIIINNEYQDPDETIQKLRLRIDSNVQKLTHDSLKESEKIEIYEILKTETKELIKEVKSKGIWWRCPLGIRTDALNTIAKMHGKDLDLQPISCEK